MWPSNHIDVVHIEALSVGFVVAGLHFIELVAVGTDVVQLGTVSLAYFGLLLELVGRNWPGWTLALDFALEGDFAPDRLRRLLARQTAAAVVAHQRPLGFVGVYDALLIDVV